MPQLKLVIANKNYSSWSMRPWVLLDQAGIEFTELLFKFNDDGKLTGLGNLSPTGQVPVRGSRTDWSMALSLHPGTGGRCGRSPVLSER